MESYQDASNTPQIVTYPKRYNRWSSRPQYWIILVQVNPGEILTIKGDDGTIQNIHGPADVPLMSPSGTLPPIYLPPGYMSQVVEENGIRKIVVVPQITDYNLQVPATTHGSQYMTHPPVLYPHATQMMYPPAQGEFPVTYFQEPVVQQLLPPLPPLPALPPAPATYMYQDYHETYSYGRANYNEFDERPAKTGEYKKMKDRPGGCKNKATSITPAKYTPDVYTVDNAPHIYTVDESCSTYTVDNTLSTCTENSTLSTHTFDNLPNTDIPNETPSISTDNAYNMVTTDTNFCSDTTDSTDCASTTTTSDIIVSPSVLENPSGSSSSANAANTPISENAPSIIENSLATTSAPSTTCDESSAPSTTCDESSAPSTTCDESSAPSTSTDPRIINDEHNAPLTTSASSTTDTEPSASSPSSADPSTPSITSVEPSVPFIFNNTSTSTAEPSAPSTSSPELSDPLISSTELSAVSPSGAEPSAPSTSSVESTDILTLSALTTSSTESSAPLTLSELSTTSIEICAPSTSSAEPSAPLTSNVELSTPSTTSAEPSAPLISSNTSTTSAKPSVPSTSSTELSAPVLSSTEQIAPLIFSASSTELSVASTSSAEPSAPSITSAEFTDLTCSAPLALSDLSTTSAEPSAPSTSYVEPTVPVISIVEPSTSSTSADPNAPSTTITEPSVPSISSAESSTPSISSADLSAPSTSITEPSVHSMSGAESSTYSTFSAEPSAPNTESTESTAPTTSGAAKAETNYGKNQTPTDGENKQKSTGKQNQIQSSSEPLKECTKQPEKSRRFNIEKPIVSDIQNRSAVITWNLYGSEEFDDTRPPVTFELAMSTTGKNGKYKNIYTGDKLSFNLHTLQPSMTYFLRVAARRGSNYKILSEVVNFTTPGCEPDRPQAPKLINRSKSTLNLQWKGSNENGSKINSFLLEWDEGKGENFKSCYTGTMKQQKFLKLTASTKYSFRLAARNNFGLSDFSEIAAFYTSGSMPPTPLPPKLKEADIFSLSLEWCAPANVNSHSHLTYVLEMEEPGTGLGFKPTYNGEDFSCTITNLQRSTTYKFRIFSYNMEGRSNPSNEVKYTTCPDKPGAPTQPYVKGKIHAHKVKIGWQSPKDNGGAHILSYTLEVNDNAHENVWNIIYSGSIREFLCDHLQPDRIYKLRVFCTSPVGHSQPSDELTVQTPALAPSNRTQSSNHKKKSKETSSRCANPPATDNSEAPMLIRNTENNQDFGPEHADTLGSHPVPCESASVPRPPAQCSAPVLTCKGPTCIVVSWTVPECNGAEITDYKVELGQTEESMQLIYTGICLRYEVKSLIPATTYFCRVQAVNVIGVGQFGETATITTPATVPSIVQNLQEVPDKVPENLASSCLAIKWEEPICNGSPVTGYNIEYGDRRIMTIDTVTEYILKNLQPDTMYKIRIQAINHYGLSPFSQPIRSKTKPLLLNPPPLECAILGHQSLKLKWGNNSNRRILSSLISYNLFMKDRSDRFSVIYHGPCQTHRVQRLTECTEYSFKIQACNEAGEGPESDIYVFTTKKTPPAALQAPRIHRLKFNACEIKWGSLEPINGDPIVYNLQVITDKGTEQLYKGPNTSFSYSNFVTNTNYRFKVCAGRQYKTSAGKQELWGPFSPTSLFLTHRNSKGGRGGNDRRDDKLRIELSDESFIFILVIVFAALALLSAASIQKFLIS
ncbi:fibronectin type III domain containing protein 3C1-like [Dipodomys spectabilis]|uniref:fibronectin type III domain containing protein 3C1-like n=1 Tax=Dipodomys spectabilis TaxID=105255 RepID=UPI001C54BA39|nr:fibronectin type III domain containing protein 3C1-like [Dipodomys spectabilis]